MTRETKTFPFLLKSSNDEEGTIEGYLSVFNVVDQGKDRVLKGAFKRTLQNSAKAASANNSTYLFPMLWQHDDKQPIGGVISAEEDDHGLKTTAQFDMDVQRGREAYSAYKKGYMNQLSIGYDVIKKSYDAKGVRDLEELRLWEQSTVTFAMNEEALVTGVKTMLLTDLERKALSAAHSSMIAQKAADLHAQADAHLEATQKTASAMHTMAMQHMQAGAEHAKSLHTAADDLASVLQGSEPAYTTDHGTPEKADPRSGALSSKSDSSDMDTQIAQALARLEKLSTAKKY